MNQDRYRMRGRIINLFANYCRYCKFLPQNKSHGALFYCAQMKAYADRRDNNSRIDVRTFARTFESVYDNFVNPEDDDYSCKRFEKAEHIYECKCGKIISLRTPYWGTYMSYTGKRACITCNNELPEEAIERIEEYRKERESESRTSR